MDKEKLGIGDIGQTDRERFYDQGVMPTLPVSCLSEIALIFRIDRSNAVKEKTHLSEQARKQALDQISRDKENMIVEGAESIEEDSDLVIAHMRELHVSTIMRLKVKRQREGKA